MRAGGLAAATLWPIRAERLELEAVGRTIPQARHESPAALATVPALPARLIWRLQPAG